MVIKKTTLEKKLIVPVSESEKVCHLLRKVFFQNVEQQWRDGPVDGKRSSRVSTVIMQTLQKNKPKWKDSEKYVVDCNFWTDAWGVLAFTSNTHLHQKVMYERTQQHLQHV